MDDSPAQSTQISSVSEANKSISVTPRIKRRQNSTQNDVSMDRFGTAKNTPSVDEAMEVTGMRTEFKKSEEQQRAARERSAMRRAALSPEEAEEQRMLNRERNAARRANLTSEETEHQRILTRERSAARRATLSQRIGAQCSKKNLNSNGSLHESAVQQEELPYPRQKLNSKDSCTRAQ